MASDLSNLDPLIIQIDGLPIGNELVLVAALGIDANGDKHSLGLPKTLLSCRQANAALVG